MIWAKNLNNWTGELFFLTYIITIYTFTIIYDIFVLSFVSSTFFEYCIVSCFIFIDSKIIQTLHRRDEEYNNRENSKLYPLYACCFLLFSENDEYLKRIDKYDSFHYLLWIYFIFIVQLFIQRLNDYAALSSHSIHNTSSRKKCKYQKNSAGTSTSSSSSNNNHQPFELQTPTPKPSSLPSFLTEPGSFSFSAFSTMTASKNKRSCNDLADSSLRNDFIERLNKSYHIKII